MWATRALHQTAAPTEANTLRDTRKPACSRAPRGRCRPHRDRRRRRSREAADASEYLKALRDIGVLNEEKAGRDKLFIHPRLMTLLKSEEHVVPPYQS